MMEPADVSARRCRRQRPTATLRHDWPRAEAQALYEAPFNDLLFRAHTVHRRYFDPNTVQMSRLLSIKTGGCAEDCGYCSQSAHHASGLKATKLMDVERVLAEARSARATPAPPATAWAPPGARPRRATWTCCAPWSRASRRSGMETCMTLGMLSDDDVGKLKGAGLDYYNHNIDTSERYYSKVITTRTFADRLRDAGARARGRHQGVLRRHRRHGRGAGGPRRHAGDAGQSARSIPKACRSTC